MNENSHVSNVGILLTLGKIAKFTEQKLINIKETQKEVKKGRKWKSETIEKWEKGKNKGKGKTSRANVRFAEIASGDPRNAVISTDHEG